MPGPGFKETEKGLCDRHGRHYTPQVYTGFIPAPRPLVLRDPVGGTAYRGLVLLPLKLAVPGIGR
ncbi:hypothetical protein Jiend_61750 [Micromonospora endophytica]|nr:hypothetical protein Jiend_61750 [Micromonospora endophytica]